MLSAAEVCVEAALTFDSLLSKYRSSRPLPLSNWGIRGMREWTHKVFVLGLLERGLPKASMYALFLSLLTTLLLTTGSIRSEEPR